MGDPTFSRSLSAFYRHHYQAEDLIGDDETVGAFIDAHTKASLQVARAACRDHLDLLEKLRVFEICFFEDGGDYTDGRELTWLGAIKADIMALAPAPNAPAKPRTEPPIPEGNELAVEKLRHMRPMIEFFLTVAVRKDYNRGAEHMAAMLVQFGNDVLKAADEIKGGAAQKASRTVPAS